MPRGIYIRTERHIELLREQARVMRLRVIHMPRGGKYSAIHAWLIRRYGNADRCEYPQCNGLSKVFHWAKRRGFLYEHKRENFIMLCVSCHSRYDWDDEKRQRLLKIGIQKGEKIAARRVTAIDKNGNVVGVYISLVEAGKTLGILPTSITNALTGRSKSAGGFIWQ